MKVTNILLFILPITVYAGEWVGDVCYNYGLMGCDVVNPGTVIKCDYSLLSKLYWYESYKCAGSMKCYHKDDGGAYCA